VSGPLRHKNQTRARNPGKKEGASLLVKGKEFEFLKAPRPLWSKLPWKLKGIASGRSQRGGATHKSDPKTDEVSTPETAEGVSSIRNNCKKKKKKGSSGKSPSNQKNGKTRYA